VLRFGIVLQVLARVLHTHKGRPDLGRIRDRTIPLGFTVLVSVPFFGLRAYGVSSLADAKWKSWPVSNSGVGCDIGGSTRINIPQEITGGYLWSPKRNATGARNPFYESMREVSPGDLIFSFVDTRVAAIGIAKSYCWECRNQLSLVLWGRTGKMSDGE